MKSKLISCTGLFTYTLIFLFLFSVKGFAQENDVDNYKTLFYFNTTKQADNSRLLEVEFLARNKENKKDKIAVVAAPIKFYNISDEDEVLLGTANTDNHGKAVFVVSAEQEYLLDEDGYINILASFEGTDELDEEEEEVMVMDLQLEMELKVEDSIQMVYLRAFTLDSLGEEIPVEELDIIIGVESMLAKMPLDEGTMEEGEYEFEMPMDVPGDHNGDLVVYAYVDDHEDYINVLKSEKINWGRSLKDYKAQNNLLWSDAAPIWMYIVLGIMLVGIWANFFSTARNLFKIKKMGDN